MKKKRLPYGFTLLELLTVIAVIVVLASLILHGMGYAQQKAAASRALAEIQAMSLMAESFKIDHGDYPSSVDSANLDPTAVKPSDAAYKNSAVYLSLYLLGPSALPDDADNDDINVKVFRKYWKAYGGAWKADGFSSSTIKVTAPNIYKPSLSPDELDPSNPKYDAVAAAAATMDTITVPIRYVIDPFGYAYGYSTKGVFNPTFDFWSSAATTDIRAQDQAKWIKNW